MVKEKTALITKYKTTHNNKETKRRRVNASLVTDLPEIPNRPSGLFGQLAVVTEHALRYEVHHPLTRHNSFQKSN